MSRNHIISRYCMCLYSTKQYRKCGSKVFLIVKNIVESFEWKNKH